MEQVLDVYAWPLNEHEPLVAMDESQGTAQPGPAARARSARQPYRESDQYERHGTCAMFMFFAPLLGWRRVSASDAPHSDRLGPPDSAIAR